MLWRGSQAICRCRPLTKDLSGFTLNVYKDRAIIHDQSHAQLHRPFLTKLSRDGPYVKRPASQQINSHDPLFVRYDDLSDVRRNLGGPDFHLIKSGNFFPSVKKATLCGSETRKKYWTNRWIKRLSHVRMFRSC